MIMDHPENKPTTPLLFNDVYFHGGREAVSPAPDTTSTWNSFPRLPVELRLHIWLLFLRQHRMIEVDLSPVAGDCPRYTNRNHLGRIVSGHLYTLHLRGRGAYAASLSPLLRVNREARGAAHSFYHVHLPFPAQQDTLGAQQILYLSPEYDIVCVRPRRPEITSDPRTRRNRRHYPRFSTILVDFLHDARAYDYKDQGHVSIHSSLASSSLYSKSASCHHWSPESGLTYNLYIESPTSHWTERLANTCSRCLQHK